MNYKKKFNILKLNINDVQEKFQVLESLKNELNVLENITFNNILNIFYFKSVPRSSKLSSDISSSSMMKFDKKFDNISSNFSSKPSKPLLKRY